MDRRQKLIEIFEDTQRFYSQNAKLANAVQMSKAATKLYEADEYPEITKKTDNSTKTTMRIVKGKGRPLAKGSAVPAKGAAKRTALVRETGSAHVKGRRAADSPLAGYELL